MKRMAITSLLIGLLVPAVNAQAAEPIRIGHTNWASNLTTTHVVKTIIENRMDRDVELVNADPAALYAGVASGDIDIFTESSLPTTHEDYYDKVASDIISLGPIYPRLRQGWAVPSYVPRDKVNSLDDLKSKEIMERFDGQVVGIDPGSGLMRISNKAMEERGLADFGYELQSSSGPGMTSALKRAIDQEEWIIVTAWKPHWLWARWDMRFIAPEVGEDALYEHEDTTVTIVNEWFFQKAPEVYDMLDRITIPMDDLQKAIFEAQNSSYNEAAKQYVKDHPKEVEYWVTGELPE